MNTSSLLRRSRQMAIAVLSLAGASAGAATVDDQLAEHVDQQVNLSADADRVKVTVKDGTVVIEGRVESPYDRKRIIRTAEEVSGVVAVESRLTIAPELRDNDELRRDIVTALEHHPATADLDVRIMVDGGVVTLAGQTKAAASSRLAISIIEQIRGVKDVVDRIQVLAAGRPDEEIESDLVVELAAATALNDPVHVAVNNGSVRLSGVVDSASERSWAVEKAWSVSGVHRVDATALRVDPRLQAQQRRALSRGDAQRAIASAFRNDPQVGASQPKVRLEGPVAVLTGEVATLAAKRRAEQLALLVVGVRSVENRITVTPATRVADEELQALAQAAFARSVLLDAAELNVVARDGQLTLTGRVDSEVEKRLAEDLAALLPGATKIVNEIEVRLVRDDRAARTGMHPARRLPVG